MSSQASILQVSDLSPQMLQQVASWLAEADHVLITAGAGMSVDAGFDYTRSDQFVPRYPVLAARGPQCRYHVFGYAWASEAEQWGHIARHLEELRYAPPPNALPYVQLQALTAGKNRFVLTSNADDLFERSGFDAKHLWTRQGSYSRLQCFGACDAASTWLADEWVARAVPAVDLVSEELRDPTLIPHCPTCGGPAMLNVRGGDWFIDAPYLPQGERFGEWWSQAQGGQLLVLDVGSGFNTPSVVRWPAEQLAERHRQGRLVRVNREYPQVPAELGGRGLGLGLACSGGELWQALTAL